MYTIQYKRIQYKRIEIFLKKLPLFSRIYYNKVQ